MIAAAITACTKDKAAPSTACDTAGDGVKAYWTAKASSAAADAEQQQATAMGNGTAGRMVRHCKADGWSDDVVTCFHAASEDAALAGCMRQLTADQQQKLKSDLGNLLDKQSTH